MYVFNKISGFAVLACLGFVFSGLVACSSDDSSRAHGDTPVVVESTFVVDENGDTIVRVDTITGRIDSSRVIDPVTGDTIYQIDTIFVPADTTVHWLGNSALVITEVSPVNLDWLDENGDDPGWIEIYNAGTESANLKDYSLVENLEKPRKWVFGDIPIAAHSFITVFCDKGDVAVVDGAVSDGVRHKGAHTNWKLNKNGGSVYLIDRYYAIRDSVNYPELASGMSWGIVDGGAWKYFEKPTPEKPNNESTAYDGMAPKFDFKGKPAGFYSEAVELNPPSTDNGVTVHCTQNGSAPTKDSPKFDSKIKIEQNTVLRCAAYKDGFLTKEVVTNTYFIDEEEVKMPVVALTVDPSFFEKVYIKTSASSPSGAPELYEEIEYPVHVEYFPDGGKMGSAKAFDVDAGISLMGGYSRLNDKKSVAIEMHEEYQAGSINYPLFETRKGVNDKYKAFNLRNNGNRFVSDYIEDAMGGALLEGSGVDYQRSRQVVVFYNGKYYGIHDMRERFNRSYVETNYPAISKNSVEMVKQLGDLSHITASGDGTIDNYVYMLDFIGGQDMTNDANYERAKTLIDIGNFADYMIAEIYYHNGDWPNNNVRAWSAPGQPWKFMVYDLDHGFDWTWGVNGGEFGQDNNMFAWIKKGGGNKPCKETGCFAALYNSLIKNANFKRLFLNHAAVMLQNYLNATNVAKVVDAMTATIPSSEMDRDLEKFHQNEKYYSNSCGHGFDKTGSCLKEWASERDGKVLSEFKDEFGVGGMVSVTISSTGGTVLMEGMKLPGSTSDATNYKGQFFSGMQMELTAVPAAGGKVFAGWSDGSSDLTRLVTITDGLSISATFK